MADPENPSTRAVNNDEDETPGPPWWIWLVVGIAVLLCCICVCCGCAFRYKQIQNDKRRRECDVLQKETIVDGPVVVQRPVLYPPQPPPQTLVPYEQRLVPAPVPNTTAMVPYTPGQAANQPERLAIMPPSGPAANQPQRFAIMPGQPMHPQQSERLALMSVESDSMESESFATSVATSVVRGHMAFGADPPDDATESQSQKPLQICADPSMYCVETVYSNSVVTDNEVQSYITQTRSHHTRKKRRGSRRKSDASTAARSHATREPIMVGRKGDASTAARSYATREPRMVAQYAKDDAALSHAAKSRSHSRQKRRGSRRNSDAASVAQSYATRYMDDASSYADQSQAYPAGQMVMMDDASVATHSVAYDPNGLYYYDDESSYATRPAGIGTDASVAPSIASLGPGYMVAADDASTVYSAVPPTREMSYRQSGGVNSDDDEGAGLYYTHSLQFT